MNTFVEYAVAEKRRSRIVSGDHGSVESAKKWIEENNTFAAGLDLYKIEFELGTGKLVSLEPVGCEFSHIVLHEKK